MDDLLSGAGRGKRVVEAVTAASGHGQTPATQDDSNAAAPPNAEVAAPNESDAALAPAPVAAPIPTPYGPTHVSVPAPVLAPTGSNSPPRSEAPAPAPEPAEHGGGPESRHPHASAHGGGGRGRHAFATVFTDFRAAPEDSSASNGHTGEQYVWYDLRGTEAVADQIADQLSAIKPEHKDEFAANAAKFHAAMHQLEDTVNARISDPHRGAPVLVLDPETHDLIRDAGLSDITPPDFRQAVDKGQEPSATAVAQVHQIIASHQPAIVVLDTESPKRTEQQLAEETRKAGLPMGELTATPPANSDYVPWMTIQVDHLARGLGGQ